MTELGDLDYYQIVFPKLDIDIMVKSDAFTIFGMTIKWYGLIIAFGIIMAMLFGFSKMKKFGLDSDKAIDAVFAGMIGGIIGARLYYVFMQWEDYSSDWKSIFNIRNGGLAIYGGIIGSILLGALVAKFRKVKFLPLLDIAGMCFLIGQGIGRWGNFANHEAFGYNTGSLFGMSSGKIQEQITAFASNAAEHGIELSARYPVHPCFLYESVWCIVGFVALALFSKHRKFDGQIFIIYAGWYGLGRFFIEGLRTDSLMIGTLRISQVVAAACVVASVILLIVIGQKVKRMGSDYVLYCNSDESKQMLAEAEERIRKSKEKHIEVKSDSVEKIIDNTKEESTDVPENDESTESADETEEDK